MDPEFVCGGPSRLYYPQEDLAKFGYKLNMKENLFEHPWFFFFLIWATYLNHEQKSWKFS